MKPLSTCTTYQLLKFIKDTVPPNEIKQWHVMINEPENTIDFINPKTLEINSISASPIYYGG